MALHVHRASRADVLADGLGDLLATPLPDPFATEVVVVPARGVERWLSQRLSHRLGGRPGRGDGVCAGVDFRSPALARRRDHRHPRRRPVVARRPGLAAARRCSTRCLDEPWARTLARHLGHGLDRRGGRPAPRPALRGRPAAGPALRVVRRAAAAAGRPTGARADDTDGAGRAARAATCAWQPELWRRLVGGVDATRRRTCGTRDTLDPAARGPGGVRPARAALALRPHPAAGDRGRAARRAGGRTATCTCGCRTPRPRCGVALGRPPAAPVPRADDDHATSASATRCCRRSGATSASSSARWRRSPATPARRRHRAAGRPTRCSAGSRPTCAPTRARAAPARRLRPTTTARSRCTPATASARQVDVLREVLLGLLADDPTLEPRDVLVMCPDIETYAPLISAGFGLGDVVGDGRPPGPPAAGPARRPGAHPDQPAARRGRPAARPGRRPGRRQRRARPGPHRAGPAPVRLLRRRPRAARPAGSARPGVRWAFDAEHRARLRARGLRRRTPGASASTGCSPGSRCPTTPAPGSTARCRSTTSAAAQVDLVGRLAEYVDRLRAVTDDLVGAAAPRALARRRCADGVGVADRRPAERRRGRPARCSASSAGSPRRPAAAAAPTLRLPDVRALLADRLGGRPTRANFRTGTLTVCTMVPMRSVPHRVVCLVGLDDGVFPRSGAVDGDDVLARRPAAPASATPAARTASCCSTPCWPRPRRWSSPTPAPTSTPASRDRPPCRSASCSTPSTRTADAAGRPCPTRSPSGTRCSRSTPATSRPARWCPGTPSPSTAPRWPGRARPRGPRTGPGPFLTGPLAPRRRPRRRLARRPGVVPRAPGARLPARAGSTSPWPQDEEPAPTAARRARRPRAVGGRRPGAARPARRASTPTAAVSSASGVAACCRPAGSAGARSRGIVDEAVPLAGGRRRRCAPSSPRAVDVDVDLGGGRRLRGTVPEVYGDRLVPVSYSRLGPTHRLQSWVAAARAERRATPTATGPRTRSAGPATAARARATRSRCSARSTTTPRATCCAPWSTCATAACASRCRCR